MGTLPLSSSQTQPQKRVEICAYYYPGWHPRPGINFMEWDLVEQATPYFEGHYQPRRPLNGRYDDSDPATIRAQVELASLYKVDAFIFLWYWRNGELELEHPLRNFLQAKHPMRFSLMWCWKMPKAMLPAGHEDTLEDDDKRWVDTNPDDYMRLVDYCCENYFHAPNYRRHKDKPIISLYSVEGFQSKLGSDGLRQLLAAGEQRARHHGFAGLYQIGVTKSIINAPSLGFDALTGYNSILDPSECESIQRYDELIPTRAQAWRVMSSQHELPYILSISVGWDASARGIKIAKLSSGHHYPWTPIMVQATPESFGHFLLAAYDWIDQAGQLPWIHVCAWNEWSEGAYLEPDHRYGYQHLSTLRTTKLAYQAGELLPNPSPLAALQERNAAACGDE